MNKLPPSPLAPAQFPDMPHIDGLSFATHAAGIKYKGRDDLWMARLQPGSQWAGVFTRNSAPGAPIVHSRGVMDASPDSALPLGLIVNSGNSNVFTGAKGLADARAMAGAAGTALGCPAQQVCVASTGVIGEPLPIEKILPCAADMAKNMQQDWPAAAAAIMTTDTFPKAASASAEIGGQSVKICGIAKGSGMIAPDMATMLAFVFTDAAVPAHVLKNLLRRSADRSFNAITVDSDTSTSDTVILAATGAVGHAPVTDANAPELEAFCQALDSVMIDLAQQIVRDGEGASKFVTVSVTGAETDLSARKIGLSVANSPLVKTAIAGQDANWGRIVMAVGKSGEPADRDKLSIRLGDVICAEGGMRAAAYSEEAAAQHLQGDAIDIHIDIGLGDGVATVWTCDLTHGYISINADYRS